MARKWIVVKGYNRQVSAWVPAGTAVAAAIAIFPTTGNMEVPSYNLITRITHIGTYAEAPQAFLYCHWITPWFPYNDMQDPMGQQGAPLALADIPELNPGQGFVLRGANTDAVQHGIGFTLIGEQGRYEDVP